MKKLSLIVIVIAALGYGYSIYHSPSNSSAGLTSSSSQTTLKSAFQNRESNLQVTGEGTVVRILPDDLEGSRHQKFIIKLSSGQTLLIAHNIDLAPRINGLRAGDMVEFYGEYEWNSKGGVIHWTHHDPDGVHVGGWLKYDGRTYQ